MNSIDKAVSKKLAAAEKAAREQARIEKGEAAQKKQQAKTDAEAAEGAERNLVERLIAHLAPLVLKALTEQGYPRAEMSRRFVRRVFVFDIPTLRRHAYWELCKEGNGSLRVVLRSDGICYVQFGLFKRFSEVELEPGVYKDLRRFANNLVLNHLIEEFEDKLEPTRHQREALGMPLDRNYRGRAA
jgi:hypothetical protein